MIFSNLFDIISKSYASHTQTQKKKSQNYAYQKEKKTDNYSNTY